MTYPGQNWHRLQNATLSDTGSTRLARRNPSGEMSTFASGDSRHRLANALLSSVVRRGLDDSQAPRRSPRFSPSIVERELRNSLSLVSVSSSSCSWRSLWMNVHVSKILDDVS